MYLYDAEGRICAVATAGMDGMGPSMTGYVYDAAGNSVAKGPITKMSCDPTQNGFETSGEESDYIHNQSGQPVTKLTMDEGVMTWNYTNVYADGQLFATYDAQGLHFDLDDWLGTRRVTTDYAGVVEQTCASLPYGDQLNCTGSVDAPNEQHFTGKTHDTESGLDYFGARYYNENDARFMSPDPLGGHLQNPQTLDKYVYVADNPLSLTDPTGLDFYLTCQKSSSTCQSETVGYDKNGKAQTALVQGITKDNKFTATRIGNDGHGGLVDETTGTGAYTASVNGSGVHFSTDGGQTSSTGVFVNGTPNTLFQDAGWANGGALSQFSYNFTNSKLEANQLAAGTFSFSGTPDQAGAALQHAGFNRRYGIEGGIEYRSPGSFWTGANSGHFIFTPNMTLPTAGKMHFGEHSFGFNPLSDLLHCVSDRAGLCQ